MADKRKKHYQRVILKLSGEALVGDDGYGISSDTIERIGHDIKTLINDKIQIGVVVGGGNFFRGARLNDPRISRITGDQLGMIATVLNAIAMQEVFSGLKMPVKMMSALPIAGVIEQYSHKKALYYLESGNVVIFAGGTGNPLVTTDTALCLRGIELNADLLLKATNVDGVYDKDPKKNPNAKFYPHLTYDETLEKKLKVMDLTAFCLGRDYNMKLRVFNIGKKGALLRAVRGENEGTLVE